VVLRGVKVGPVEPGLAPGLALAEGAALLELSEAGLPGWLLGVFVVAAAVLLALGLRAAQRTYLNRQPP
jgi:hypothetical protein